MHIAMAAAALWDLSLFSMVVVLFGAACAPVSLPDPLQRLIAGIVIGLGLSFGIGFVGFAMGASNQIAAIAVAVVIIATLGLRRQWITLLRDPSLRAPLGAWLVLAAWSLGLLALVRNYSGGGWAADWLEHWQRTRFIFHREPLNTQFLGVYSFTARPPLVNLLAALWLQATSGVFAHFQVFLTLFGTLVLLPTYALARRWGAGAGGIWWLLLLFMVSPMVAQNLTFAWTKLPTAFFVLAGLQFVISVIPVAASRTALRVSALALGLAITAHYSAVPWLLALCAAGAIAGGARRLRPMPLREAAVVLLLLTAAPAAWLTWSATAFGSHDTLASNTTASNWSHQSTSEHITVPLHNLADTLVPFPLRGEPTDNLIRQQSRLGRIRDVAFSVYQVNLPLAFGLGGLFVLLISLARSPQRSANPVEKRFFVVLLPIVVIVGVAVHTARDHWGLAHICLQPLVLLGLGWIATVLSSAPLVHRVIWLLAAFTDFALGIALQIGIESGRLDRLIVGAAPVSDVPAHLAVAATINAQEKVMERLSFLGDAFTHATVPLVLWLALLLAFVMLRVRNAHATPPAV